METKKNKRSTFSGKIGFVLSAAGASVGLGNIWRFPYLAAKYGGGIFLLIYILLALTFGYTMIVAESALGRMTRNLFCNFLYIHIVDYLCRCEKWNRKSFKVHDADFGRSVCHYCDLFGDKTRSYGRSKIFPRAESEELFMDDGCGSYGTDVLFPVYCYGYSDYIWLLYEKRQFH